MLVLLAGSKTIAFFLMISMSVFLICVCGMSCICIFQAYNMGYKISYLFFNSSTEHLVQTLILAPGHQGLSVSFSNCFIFHGL